MKTQQYIVLVLITGGVGIIIGSIGLMRVIDTHAATYQSSSTAIPVFTPIPVAPSTLLSETPTPSPTPTPFPPQPLLPVTPPHDWHEYADPSGTYRLWYPGNWVLKKGYELPDGVGISDPTSHTTWGENGGGSFSSETYWIDIVSVKADTSPISIPLERSRIIATYTKDDMTYILSTQDGESAVGYMNVDISNNRYKAHLHIGTIQDPNGSYSEDPARIVTAFETNPEKPIITTFTFLK